MGGGGCELCGVRILMESCTAPVLLKRQLRTAPGPNWKRCGAAFARVVAHKAKDRLGKGCGAAYNRS